MNLHKRCRKVYSAAARLTRTAHIAEVDRMHAGPKHTKMLGRVSGVHADEDDKRTGHLSGTVCGRQSTVQQPGKHRALGRKPRLQRRTNSLVGWPAVRLEARCGEQDLLRRSVWYLIAPRFAFDGIVDASARPARRRASSVRYCVRRLRARFREGEPPRAASVGGATVAVCRESVRESGPSRARHVFRSAGLALHLSLAAASRRTNRNSL